MYNLPTVLSPSFTVTRPTDQGGVSETAVTTKAETTTTEDFETVVKETTTSEETTVVTTEDDSTSVTRITTTTPAPSTTKTTTKKESSTPRTGETNGVTGLVLIMTGAAVSLFVSKKKTWKNK